MKIRNTMKIRFQIIFLLASNEFSAQIQRLSLHDAGRTVWLNNDLRQDFESPARKREGATPMGATYPCKRPYTGQ